MTKQLDDNDIAWLNEYASSVTDTFSEKFGENSDRFKEGSQLVERFNASIAEVKKRGRKYFRAVDEAHNELCIALALLENKEPRFLKICYEPPLANTEKTIDFYAEAQNGVVVYVDVKTITPMAKDRWEQYERALQEGWFPKDVAFTVDKEWLGGELWHDAFTARGRILEYTLELEQKIAQSKLSVDENVFVLALCGEGFHWHQDELEDFVAFYRAGQHRVDDPFSLAEDKYIKEQGLLISHDVSRFACLRRPLGDLFHKRLNWNVQLPADPTFY